MDIRQIMRFVTVAELGSFNRAAQLLAVSQPSLTRSIQLLEQELDARLFERGARGAELTTFGEELLPRARMILIERDRAIAAIGALRGLGGGERVAIGTDAIFATSRLPDALAELARRDNEACFRVIEGGVAELLPALREGRLSMVLGSRGSYLDIGDLVFEALVEEGASMLLRRDHPVLAGGKPSLSDLVGARWIVPDQDNLVQGWSDMFIRQGLPVPPIALQTSSLQVVRRALLAGDFVSLGDHTTHAEAIAAGELVCLDIERPGYARPAGLFRRRGSKLSARERALISLLRQQACG